MPTRVTVTDDFQIDLPAEAREELHIRAGDPLLVEVRDGALILVPVAETDDSEAAAIVQRLRGLHHEIWSGVDSPRYLDREREAWRS